MSMYLTMKEGVPKCFLEEVPKDTLIVSEWRTENMPNNPLMTNYGNGQQTVESRNIGFFLTLKDPENQIIYTHDHDRNDKFSFTSNIGGIYELCFVTSSAPWFEVFEFVFLFKSKNQINFFSIFISQLKLEPVVLIMKTSPNVNI